MRGPAPSLSRRTTLALAGLAAGTGLAGCSADSLEAPRRTASPSPNVDQPLVDEVATTLTAAMVAAPPAFRALHQAHLRALPAADAARPTGRPRDWRARERRLAGYLADAAVRAHDGALAQLLASMAAGQRQLLLARGLA